MEKCFIYGKVCRTYSKEESLMAKCCICGKVFDVGYQMSDDKYVCSNTLCCFEYCRLNGNFVRQEIENE